MNDYFSFASAAIFYLLIFLFSIAAQVLLACAAYQDAKSLNNKDAAMWAVLIGLLGWIPGIVYLCIRKSSGNSAMPVQQICIGCRAPIAPGTNVCPYCGAQQPPMNPYLMAGYRSPEECAACHARAKKLLIAGIVCFALAIVSAVIMAVVIVGALNSQWQYYSDLY